MITCAWIVRAATPAARIIRRHIVGPVVRRAPRTLRHAAVYVCSGGAMLVPLPGGAPLAPAGALAPLYGDAAPLVVPSTGPLFGGSGLLVSSVIGGRAVLDVPGPVVVASSRDTPTTVPAPAITAVWLAATIGVVLFSKGGRA